MRLVFFLLISLALHFGMMMLTLSVRPVSYPSQGVILRVQLLNLSLSPLNDAIKSADNGILNKQTNTHELNNNVQVSSHPKEAETSTHKQLTRNNAESANRNANSIEINTAGYYPPAQLNRRAMLQLSLDSSTINPELSSGLPIKLRLYVNKLGHVVKIERMGLLEQDSAFAEQLEQQLFQASFLPARRNGLDVDSYMDIELSFNPLTTFEN